MLNFWEEVRISPEILNWKAESQLRGELMKIGDGGIPNGLRWASTALWAVWRPIYKLSFGDEIPVEPCIGIHLTICHCHMLNM